MSRDFSGLCAQLLVSFQEGRLPVPTDQFYHSFLSAFTDDWQRLIVHGYGRLIAFGNVRISTAIAAAMRLPPVHIRAAVQGIAFASSMMNPTEFHRLVDEIAIRYAPEVRMAFQNGLAYGLVFADWFAPGLLKLWRPIGKVEAELVALARDEAELSRNRGFILPFRLHTP
jgi:hypothetical protein